MAGKGKAAWLGFGVSALLYGTLPMLLALPAVGEWTDPQQLLAPTLLAAAVSAAAGTLLLVRRGKWAVLPAALLTGPVVQLLAMLVGYLAFGAISIDRGRLVVTAASFAAALLAGVMLPQRRGGKRRHRKKS